MGKNSLNNNQKFAYIGNLIKEYRFNFGFTQEQLSEYSDLHVNTVIRAEAGEPISLTSLFKIANGLGISEKEIFEMFI